jgi:hypothetical protein
MRNVFAIFCGSLLGIVVSFLLINFWLLDMWMGV